MRRGAFELERRWDASLLLKQIYTIANRLKLGNMERFDRPFGCPSSPHCDEELHPNEIESGRDRDVSKDVSGSRKAHALTVFTKTPDRYSARLYPEPDPRRHQKAVAKVPVRHTYKGKAAAMGAKTSDGCGEYNVHNVMPPEVEGGGGVWTFNSINDRIEMSLEGMSEVKVDSPPEDDEGVWYHAGGCDEAMEFRGRSRY